MAERPPRPGETLSFDWTEKVPGPPASAPPPVAAPGERQAPSVLTVAQLGRMLGRTVERTFQDAVWVEGEVTGARSAASGHLYFCLRDEEEDAAIDVVLYRTNLTPRSRSLARDGARVRVRGRPTFWSPRGRLQLVSDRVEPTGKGALLEALEKLKKKLADEGLFAQERKRPLPRDPRVVGVVTSPGGAVIHDIYRVAFRRGSARILLASAQVQGPGAAESLRRGLRMLQRIPTVDVIVVARGGGSQDDLLAFWDEGLARDVAASRVPVVSAVGHETDVTLVDFAADARAATPSQAAELVIPDEEQRRRVLSDRTERLVRAMRTRIQGERGRHARISRDFRDPRFLIASALQRVDEHTARLARFATKRLSREREKLATLSARLTANHPNARIFRDRARLADLRSRLDQSARVRLARDRAQATALVGRLDAMSPLSVLSRGYAIAMRPDGRAIRNARDVVVGEPLYVRVAHGAVTAQITGIEPEEER